MQKTTLLSSSVECGGKLCHLYRWRDYHVRVIDDAENVLLIIDLFANKTFSQEEKYVLLMMMLFPDPQKTQDALGDDLKEFLPCCLWDLCGLDIDGSHKSEYEEKVMDFEQDAAAIKTSLLQAYGLRWESLKDSITYAEFCELLGMVPHETPFGQAIYYRTAKEPKRTKFNDDEVKHFRKCKQFWALRCGNASLDPMEEMNNKATAMFDSFERAARNG